MSFWKDLQANAVSIRKRFDELWKQAGEGPISQEQAQETLDVMWKRSHLDILTHIPNYKSYFPTEQGYRERLKDVQNLWWVDHATAGINGWGTLRWFSSRQRKHVRRFKDKDRAMAYGKRREGIVEQDGKLYRVIWRGYANAVTHFVVFTNGLPFYVVNLDDGAWGEPKRNGDAIQVEMVNALKLHLKDGQWCYWAGKLPPNLVKAQPPATLEQPFRGAHTMQPYTWDQVISNIKLKRLCIAATGRMHPDRMSQHTDWKESKFDMGPLWPFDLCNQAAFETYPIEDYSFMKRFVHAEGMDDAVDVHEIEFLENEAKNIEADHNTWDADDTIDTVKEIQQVLMSLYGKSILPKYGADGDLGNETTKAVRHFQANWNQQHPTDKIKVDGVPGLQTCKRLETALVAGTAFQKLYL